MLTTWQTMAMGYLSSLDAWLTVSLKLPQILTDLSGAIPLACLAQVIYSWSLRCIAELWDRKRVYL